VQENTLDTSLTVYQTIENIATNEWTNPARMRGLLGTFLFKEDDMDKKVKVLSGGEKSRLALAKMLLVSRNLLVMDEPTNHLDIASKETLKKALLEYNGTLVVVSHDRDFLDGLTTKTFEFIDGKVKEHLGPISDFLRKHESETFRDFETSGNASLKKPVVKQKPEVTPEKESYQEKKERDKAMRKLEKEISVSEKKISQLEEKIAEIEKSIAQQTSENPVDLYHKHAELSRELEQVMTVWENQNLQLEELQG
jgi:ATP-binding cassette subfamily F protein 3